MEVMRMVTMYGKSNLVGVIRVVKMYGKPGEDDEGW
jgi:hypothetical protein